MRMSLALGIDIGATKVAYSLVDSTGDVLASHRIETNASDAPLTTLDRIADGIRFMMSGRDLSLLGGIGIGSPGNIDAENGVVRLAVNLNWHDVPVRAELLKRIPDLPRIILDTDVQAWVAAERVFGVAKDTNNFIYIALGTGLGATAVVDGKSVRGVANCAMELGHVIVQDNPRRRLEEFVSGIGMMTLYDTLRDQYPQSALTHVDPVTPRDILDRVGDPLTLAILNEMSQWLGRALAWACTAFNPDAVIIGGGFGQALMPYIQTDVLNYVREHTLPLIHQHLEIRLSSVQESAIGPACFVWLNPGVTGDD